MMQRTFILAWFVVALACATWPCHAASRACERVRLVLAPGVTPEIVARDWATGEEHAEARAAVELRGCDGELLDRLELEASLATLDPTPLRGAPHPTWLASADLTAPAGSTSGPLTMAIEVVDRRLRIADAVGPGGVHEPIRLPVTGKAAWKRAPAKDVDDLLVVQSEPVDGGFATTLRRYHPAPRGWQMRSRRQAGLWESDGPFPPARSFP